MVYDERFNDFSVEELASEPAAFAAAALERLEIEPEDGGVSYAVFDFGGGTTDLIMVSIVRQMKRKKMKVGIMLLNILAHPVINF